MCASQTGLLNRGVRYDSVDQYHWWQGASGWWHIHTVFRLADWPSYRNVNYVFVRRDRYGDCLPIYIGETGDMRTRMPDHEKLPAAFDLGANEIHVHLLANSIAHRIAVETDLRRGHWTPLNWQ